MASRPIAPQRPPAPGAAPIPVPAEASTQPSPWVAGRPPWTPRAMDALRDARLPKEKQGEIVRAATAMTKQQERAWVIACVVRACIDGMRAGDVFDINRYVVPEDLTTSRAAKLKKEGE